MNDVLYYSGTLEYIQGYFFKEYGISARGNVQPYEKEASLLPGLADGYIGCNRHCFTGASYDTFFASGGRLFFWFFRESLQVFDKKPVIWPIY